MMYTALSLINKNAKENTQEFIRACESRFDSALNEVTERFLSDSDYDIVLLAGPSSSGKTTTAGILAEKIRRSGRNAYIVSLDDFYLNQDDIPVNEEGLKDYENVTALDIELMHKCFNDLIVNRKAELPIFDFMTSSRSVETKHIELEKDDVIIVEGLHALNPVITDGLDEGHLYRIYISVSSRVSGNDGRILLNKRNLRLIRRMIRDYRHRNSPVEHTFFMWQGVLKGEDKFLFPFESYADVKINSFHAYETCIFKNEALRLLNGVGEKSEFFEKAQELIGAISLFEEIEQTLLPEKSLLNEFLTL
ncbi:MAG: nucleoside kinase [Clostridia bacterium]|nr:nucleoside kinase [Clostridia bacterium]